MEWMLGFKLFAALAIVGLATWLYGLWLASRTDTIELWIVRVGDFDIDLERDTAEDIQCKLERWRDRRAS